MRHKLSTHKILTISMFVLMVSLLSVIALNLQDRQEVRQYAQTTGNQLFVSPNGNGDCSQASPCSLTAADAKATPGTTIIVASGTYPGPFVTTKGGSAGQFITYKSQEKHGATITSNGEGNSMSIVEIKNEYVRFQDFTITGAQARHGFHLDANNVEVIGNHIHTLVQWKTGSTGWKGGAGVQTGMSTMSGLVIDGNHIHHIGAPGSTEQLVHGMYIDAHVSNSRVSNNVIHDVEDFALHPYPESEASGWQFINNTIYNTGRGILQAPNGVTRNNIVFNTRGAAYDIRGSGNVVSNNIAGGTGSGGAAEGVTKADPMFVNFASGDVHLQPGSPAIDKGTAEGAPTIDYEGKTRPQGAGFDIGAIESGGASNGVITPPFFPIAPCPTCVDPTQAPVSGAPLNPSVNVPDPTVSQLSPVPNPEPCTTEGASLATSREKHWKHGGGISGLMEALIRFFMELINLLIKLFGGSPIEIPNQGNPLSPGNPENPNIPSQPVEQPQPQPCEPVNPSPELTQAPQLPVSPVLSPSTPVVSQPIVDPAARLFTGDFETGNFNQWQESQASGDWSQQIVTTPKRQGNYAAKFELRDGDCPDTGGTCYGERTERGAGSAESGGQEGDERWYQWSTQFGSPFPTSHTWGVISQWHAEADGSPPVSFNVDGSNGTWGLQIHKQSSPGQYDATYTPWNASLAPGTWHDIKIHIKWSTSDNGFIELWHNGAPQTFTGAPCAGQTKCMVQTLVKGGGGTYFKQGYYRDQGVSGTGIIYHDGFTAAKTEAGLGPLQ